MGESPTPDLPQPNRDPLDATGSARDLEETEQEVYQGLCERDGRLGAIYLGALLTLRQRANPERFPQAAHSLREMMNLLPAVLEVATPEHHQMLGGQVRGLEQLWRSRR